MSLVPPKSGSKLIIETPVSLETDKKHNDYY